MGFLLSTQAVNDFLRTLSQTHRVVAPVRFVGGGAFTDTDCVRYAEITDIAQVVFDGKKPLFLQGAAAPALPDAVLLH